MIYFLKRQDGLVKIGYTARLDIRIRTLEKQFGALELLGLMPGQLYEEHDIHHKFETDRVYGNRREWFRLTEELVEFIKLNAPFLKPDQLIDTPARPVITSNSVDPIHKNASIRTRLAELRAKSSLTRMDIVRFAGLSYMTVSKWETGALDSIEASTINVLCKLLNCSLGDLIYLQYGDSE